MHLQTRAGSWSTTTCLLLLLQAPAADACLATPGKQKQALNPAAAANACLACRLSLEVIACLGSSNCSCRDAHNAMVDVRNYLPLQLPLFTLVHVHAGKPLMEGCTRSFSVSLEPPGWRPLKPHGATSSSRLQGEKVFQSVFDRLHDLRAASVGVDKWWCC